MAAFQNVRDSFARLSPREKMLVGACVVALLGFVLFLVFHTLGGRLSALSKRVDKQDEQLAEIMQSRGKFREAEAQFREVEAMLRRPAPALRGFLENKAKALGINIQEYKDLAPVLLGRKKEVEERAIVAYPVKPDLKQLATFLAQIENTREHFLVIKDLRLDRAFDNHDQFQRAEITVATYSQVAAAPSSPGPGSARPPAGRP